MEEVASPSTLEAPNDACVPYAKPCDPNTVPNGNCCSTLKCQYNRFSGFNCEVGEAERDERAAPPTESTTIRIGYQHFENGNCEGKPSQQGLVDNGGCCNDCYSPLYFLSTQLYNLGSWGISASRYGNLGCPSGSLIATDQIDSGKCKGYGLDSFKYCLGGPCPPSPSTAISTSEAKDACAEQAQCIDKCPCQPSVDPPKGQPTDVCNFNCFYACIVAHGSGHSCPAAHCHGAHCLPGGGIARGNATD